MAISSYPFDGGTVNEVEYGLLFREFANSGVADDIDGSGFRVSANSTGMKVTVAPGFAVLRGHAVQSTATETVTIAAASGAIRYDLVVLRLNPAENEIALAVLTGTPGAGTPQPTQTDSGIYELPLASVIVLANAVSIASGDVSDKRVFVGQAWQDTNRRPTSPRTGTLGYNKATGKWEFYNGNTWGELLPSLEWTSIIGRPTSMPPTAHNHLWEQIQDKPTTFPPSAHGHPWGQISGKPTTFPPSGHSHTWSEITGKPTTFTPKAHTHSGSEITSQVQNSIYAKRSDEADGTRLAHDQNANGAGPWYSVWVNADRQFMRNTSSIRYKENVEDHNVDPAAVLALQPRMYDRIGERAPKGEYGLIAEEVAETLPEVVIHDENGVIDSVRYDLIAVALLSVVKDQERRIAELEARLT